MVRLLARVIGVGIETADMLVHEILSPTPASPALPTKAARGARQVGSCLAGRGDSSCSKRRALSCNGIDP